MERMKGRGGGRLRDIGGMWDGGRLKDRGVSRMGKVDGGDEGKAGG